MKQDTSGGVGGTGALKKWVSDSNAPRGAGVHSVGGPPLLRAITMQRVVVAVGDVGSGSGGGGYAGGGGGGGDSGGIGGGGGNGATNRRYEIVNGQGQTFSGAQEIMAHYMDL